MPNGGVEPALGLVPAVPSIGSTVQRPERSVLGVIERTAGRDVAQAAGVTAGISNPERTRAPGTRNVGGNVAAVSVHLVQERFTLLCEKAVLAGMGRRSL